jgi:FkbM family methyltransferase
MGRLTMRWLVDASLKLWRRAAPVATVPGTGIRLTVPPGDAPVRMLMAWRPDWKTRAIAAILRARQGTFLDVGANVGSTLLDFVAAKVPGAYVGFEPNIACARQLLELVSRNRLDRCRIVPAGLGDRNEVRPLYLFGGDADPGASTRPGLRPDRIAGQRDACLYRLDDLGELVGDAGIALIKIDVEGSELEALRGMERTLREKRPWILCEVLDRDPSAEPSEHAERAAGVMRLLSGLGYEAQRIVLTANHSAVSGLVPVAAFPDKVYDAASVSECEYLFVPAQDAELVRKVVLGR